MKKRCYIKRSINFARKVAGGAITWDTVDSRRQCNPMKKKRAKKAKRVKMFHIGAKRPSYVTRPSQITKQAPSKRLRKRRRKNIAKPVKGRFPNPRPLLFIITAQKGRGKKMHFDGTNFSERAKIKMFPTMIRAEAKARELLKTFPILRSYRVVIEPNRLPNHFQ